ncbi:MAG: 3-deoxy-manno-octulosonate cytidylyltransferase [Nitrospirae bacterium]|nr:3-deoxy-manno-octulosonate cytidylyltransferase [Nitrospirota bacterium]
MNVSKTAAVIIPARYSSTRFPGKALVSIGSKPIIQWIYDAANKSVHTDNVIVATDEQKIYDTVRGFGGNVIMTSSRLRTGSDRCSEVARQLGADIIINLQADEILQGPEMIDELILMMEEDDSIKMGSLKSEITSPGDLMDRNVVKVVTDNNDYALYFSRSPIPHIRDRINNEVFPQKTYYKHLGIYAYRRDFLLLFGSLPTTSLEELEKLEQLRVLECGYRIKLKETLHKSFRIDTPEDLKKLEEGLNHEQ